MGYNNGILGYAHSDFEQGGFRYGVGIGASTEFDHNDTKRTQHFFNGDAAVKLHGWSMTAGFYLQAVAKRDLSEEIKLSKIGGHVQAGYLIRQLAEPIARFGFVHTRHVKDDVSQQYAAGIVFHFVPSHHLKWENNVTLHKSPPGVTLTHQTEWDVFFASQLQLYF